MSLELAVVGGLIGASFVILFLISFIEKESYGYLRTILMFVALSFIIFAFQAAEGFVRIQYAATSTAGYLTIAEALGNAYVIYLIVFLFTFFYTMTVFAWKLLTELYVKFFEKNKKKTDLDVLE